MLLMKEDKLSFLLKKLLLGSNLFFIYLSNSSLIDWLRSTCCQRCWLCGIYCWLCFFLFNQNLSLHGSLWNCLGLCLLSLVGCCLLQIDLCSLVNWVLFLSLTSMFCLHFFGIILLKCFNRLQESLFFFLYCLCLLSLFFFLCFLLLVTD